MSSLLRRVFHPAGAIPANVRPFLRARVNRDPIGQKKPDALTKTNNDAIRRLIICSGERKRERRISPLRKKNENSKDHAKIAVIMKTEKF